MTVKWNTDRKGKPAPVKGSATPPETQKLAGDIEALRRALQALAIEVRRIDKPSAAMTLAMREGERVFKDTKPQ